MKRLFLLLVVLNLSSVANAQTQKPPNFSQHVLPLLRSKCLNCHNSDDQEADLDLSSYARLLKGSSSGPVVKTGSPSSSLLYQSISHADGVEAMPPKSPPLKEEQLELVASWIRGGLLEGPNSKPQSMGLGVKTPSKRIVSPVPDLKIYPRKKGKNWKRTPIPQATAASPGASLFAVSGEKQILLYGRRDAKPDSRIEFLATLDFPEGTIHQLKFSRDGTLLIAAGGQGAISGRVVLFDVKNGKRMAEMADEVDSILAADLSHDHRWLAIGNSKKVVKIFDASNGKLVHRIKKHTDWITSVAFSNRSDYVATGDRSGGVYVWEAKKGAIVLNLKEHSTQVNDLAWRADDKILASGAEDGNLILWSLKDGFPVLNKQAHFTKDQSSYTRKTGVLSIDFLADGKLLTSGRDRKIKLWKPDGSLEWQHQSQEIPVQARSTNSMKLIGLYSGKLLAFDSKHRQLEIAVE